jgi:hypothetical protein
MEGLQDREAGMTPEIRPATPADAEACGRIIFEAFSGIADQHGFPWDFPLGRGGNELARTKLAFSPN